MEQNSKETDEEKRLYDEFFTCLNSYRKSFTIVPITAMCIAGILYNPKGSFRSALVRRIFFSSTAMFVTSLGINIMGTVSCSKEYKAFVDAAMNRKKEAGKGELIPDNYQSTSSFTDNVPTTSDVDLPINWSGDTISYLPSSFEEFKPAEEIKPVKKPVTYDDLWASRHQERKSRKDYGKWHGGNPADTPTPGKRATNIYGDPLD